MIPSLAIKAYLGRSLENHHWVKGLTHKQLDEALKQLRPVPRLNARAAL